MDRTIWASQDRLLEQIDRRLVGTPVQRPPPYLESVLTKVVPAITSPPNVQESESATPIREFECNRGCRCPCHATKAYKLKFSLLRSAVGSFEVAYRCSKTPRSACQDRNCQRFGIVDAGFRDIVVVYTVPDWLARVTLSIFATSNLNGGPQMTIRVINRRPSDLLGAAGCVQSGDTAAVKWLLRTRQVSIYDVFGGDYRSLLWMAVWDRHIDIVKLLLQAGADPFAEMTASYRPPIQLVFTRWLAGSQIDEEIARLFPISEYLDRLEYSSLHLAILDILHLDLAQVLQDPSYAANIDAVGLNGLAPLHLAAIRGNVAATKHLLRFGATPDITDHQNRTPLQLSCAHAKLPVTRLLLRAGASPTKREEYGMIALHAAAGCPNKARTDDILSGLALLLQYGADINDRNYHGHTPLLSAVMGTTAAVEFLICHGADLNNRDKDGDVPLADAIMSLKYDTAALLLKSGADVAVYNNNGVGLLHFLASGADVEMMRVFTRSGRMAGKVSTAVKNNRGKTPMRLFTERQPPPSEELKKAWEELLENVEGGETSDWSDEGDEEFFDAEETVKAC
ncbi:ankyrin repeat-containing domain protein [Echria macrotheca]|uniref:Ankyrin repeat-containing domain protein n=1 Tax=Echria macrotheca TaxID=438768 RepID=A0AAJ0B0G3_9PEZI|nr:ankyrin repeat-containing domain protein [Echria macrotheca]